ncbi:hypothetical protein [Salirhabdus salicampi]|uniref:hypothetical protein n=1 Tax=Salirhabdus salicampi TaxID=476102 RepID=UPI0020C237DA|nr:hypothetical protein [Salirhabdus salicampi]MCP8615845.1 hypothetical protein [Salirhabdus salicampi]
MRWEEDKKNQTAVSITVTTIPTDTKVTPANYEFGFKRLNSKTGKKNMTLKSAKARRYV